MNNNILRSRKSQFDVSTKCKSFLKFFLSSAHFLFIAVLFEDKGKNSSQQKSDIFAFYPFTSRSKFQKVREKSNMLRTGSNPMSFSQSFKKGVNISLKFLVYSLI